MIVVLQTFIFTTSSFPLWPPLVLGVHVAVVTGHLRNRFQLRFSLGLQQRFLLLGLLLHSALRLTLAQTLRLGRVQLLDPVAAAVQPADRRLLHHQGQSRRGERKHVQKHPGKLVKQRPYFVLWLLVRCLVKRTKSLFTDDRSRVRTRRQLSSGRPWSNTT